MQYKLVNRSGAKNNIEYPNQYVPGWNEASFEASVETESSIQPETPNTNGFVDNMYIIFRIIAILALSMLKLTTCKKARIKKYLILNFKFIEVISILIQQGQQCLSE